MPRLIVKDFGCISSATLDLARLTLIIGPQSSGKSLLSKLMYFFTDLQSSYVWDETISIQKFRVDIEKEFIGWFPPSAWGKKRFQVIFIAGDMEVDITRNRASGDRVRVSLSEAFAKRVDEFSTAMKALRERDAEKLRANVLASYEVFASIRSQEEQRLAEHYKENFVRFQLFIPAGRSLFINLEQAFAATRESTSLDPLTDRFGRLFNSLRSRHPRHSSEQEEVSPVPMPALGKKLLGGSIERRKEKLYLSTDDGRSLPLSILSSGQQELLPLLMMINFWGINREYLTYIEEPEAHLFPASQSMLADYLVLQLNRIDPEDTSDAPSRLLITTHSPYLLSKINNLLKAGQLELILPDKSLKVLDSIVTKNLRLEPGSTTAYAIDNQMLKSIMGENGLIDANYLDGVSSDIIEQFSNMLDLQYADEK